MKSTYYKVLLQKCKPTCISKYNTTKKYLWEVKSLILEQSQDSQLASANFLQVLKLFLIIFSTLKNNYES